MTVSEILSRISKAHPLRGITFLGGEPFEQAGELAEIAAYAHQEGLDVLAFSGYRYEELVSDPAKAALLRHVDLLIDGRFEEDKQDFSRPLAGSSNQKFIYLTERIRPDEIAAYKNRFEIRQGADGSVTINGMGNLNHLKSIIKNISL